MHQVVHIRKSSSKEVTLPMLRPYNRNESAKRPARSNASGQVIAITSGKGGVGKSTLAVNLAITLSRIGYRILLLDGDLGLANVNVLMGIIPRHNIYEVIRGKKQISEIITPTCFGIDIIAGANGISQLANISDHQRDLFLEQLSLLEGYDIMLIDTGAGVGSNVMGLVMAAEETLVVTTPEPTAITDAYGMIKSIVANEQQKSIKLIINRVPTAMEARQVAERLSSISYKFLKTRIENLGFIFEESLVQKSIRNQRPHVVLHPGSRSTACINHIGARLVNNYNHVKSKGISDFFQRLMGSSSKDNLGAL